MFCIKMEIIYKIIRELMKGIWYLYMMFFWNDHLVEILFHNLMDSPLTIFHTI